MAIRCSTALVEPPSADDQHHGVLESLARHDVARLEIELQQVADRASRPRRIRPAFSGSSAGVEEL